MHAGIQNPWTLLAPSAWYPKMMLSNCRINKSWWFMSWAAMLNSRLLKTLSENNKEHIAHPLAGSRDDEWCDERKINITAGEERWGRWSHHETALRVREGKWLKNDVAETKLSKKQKAEKRVVGILWPVEERWWHVASLLSFKCQRLNLSSFVLQLFKMLSHGLWSLRLCCFNWIRW